MFVGRLEARKGVHVLCRSIPAVIGSFPSIRFVMVGRDTNTAPDSGSMKTFITEYSRKSGFEGNLIFIDRLSQDELIELYSACDLLVSPSIHESFGLVTLEAMACGKAVVATSTGLVPELKLAGAAVIVVSPGSADELADAVVKALSFDSEERDAAARVNRQLVESEFSLPQWVDRVVDVYQKAVQGGATRGNGSR
jgi:glycosyltransferase involved in cell wall biosynthesis